MELAESYPSCPAAQRPAPGLGFGITIAGAQGGWGVETLSEGEGDRIPSNIRRQMSHPIGVPTTVVAQPLMRSLPSASRLEGEARRGKNGSRGVMACSPYSRTTPHSPTRPPAHGPPRRDLYRTTSHALTRPADTRTLARTWAAVSCLMIESPAGRHLKGWEMGGTECCVWMDGWMDRSVARERAEVWTARFDGWNECANLALHGLSRPCCLLASCASLSSPLLSSPLLYSPSRAPGSGIPNRGSVGEGGEDCASPPSFSPWVLHSGKLASWQRSPPETEMPDMCFRPRSPQTLPLSVGFPNGKQKRPIERNVERYRASKGQTRTLQRPTTRDR